jgi:hypothetical protein
MIMILRIKRLERQAGCQPSGPRQTVLIDALWGTRPLRLVLDDQGLRYQTARSKGSVSASDLKEFAFVRHAGEVWSLLVRTACYFLTRIRHADEADQRRLQYLELGTSIGLGACAEVPPILREMGYEVGEYDWAELLRSTRKT